jgi:hypothetical protein
MVNAQGRCRSAILSWAECTRPRIFAVPTPLAIPENRVSISRIILVPSANDSQVQLCHLPTLFGAFGAHCKHVRSKVWKQFNALTDGLLSTAINKSLHWRPINLEWDTIHYQLVIPTPGQNIRLTITYEHAQRTPVNIPKHDSDSP